MAKCYVYYSTQRPIAPGTCPKEGLQKVCNYSDRIPIAGIGAAWGAVVYDHELSLEDAINYELKFGGETILPVEMSSEAIDIVTATTQVSGEEAGRALKAFTLR